MSGTPSPLPDDPAAIKAMIPALQEAAAKMSATLRAHEALVQALQIEIARLKKQRFGPSSEKIEREIEQLGLALEHLDVAVAAAGEDDGAGDDEQDPAPEAGAAAVQTLPQRRKPRLPPPRRVSASCWTRARIARNAAARCVWWART